MKNKNKNKTHRIPGKYKERISNPGLRMERGRGLRKPGNVHKSGNLMSIYFHSWTSLPWTSKRFSIFVLFIPAFHTIYESLRDLLKNKLNSDLPALLLSFLNQMLQRFPMAVRCKLKFHLGLQSPSWSSLFLPLLTQSHHFPPLVSWISDSLLPQNDTVPTSWHPTQPPHYSFSVTPMLPSVYSAVVISTGL